MTKHTPGPWKLIDVFGICSVSAGAKYVHKKYGANEKDVANARLIAAAPDLLNALQAIVKSLADQDDEGMIEHAQQMIDARAAIAKATGEQA